MEEIKLLRLTGAHVVVGMWYEEPKATIRASSRPGGKRLMARMIYLMQLKNSLLPPCWPDG